MFTSSRDHVCVFGATVLTGEPYHTHVVAYVRGSKVLVHWWYYPDSYDELVPPDSVPPEVIEPDKKPEGEFPPPSFTSPECARIPNRDPGSRKTWSWSPPF